MGATPFVLGVVVGFFLGGLYAWFRGLRTMARERQETTEAIRRRHLDAVTRIRPR